ncbi:D-amino acid dehydrogenase [Thalassotalea psychrophila]|uniref:D-amino acid dehydrogenase n=1 Tax=Thalassotalea psychrophila TaxID=3065647 RepID=A0ABY9TXX9_9GAMM|nr:D-amino acid dehydrogenase [Colwelliaceae bacterium SQ149]
MHVVVIGAGVQGINTAYYLNQLGAEVIVVDSASGPAMQCSFGNGGGITPSAVDPWNAPGLVQMLLKYIGRKDSPLLFRLKALPGLTTWGLKFLKYATMEKYIKSNQINGQLANYSVDLLNDIRQDTEIDYGFNNNGTIKIFRDQQSFDQHVELSQTLKELGNADFESLDVKQTIQLEPALAGISDKISGGIYYNSDEAGNSHIYCQQMKAVLEQRGVNFLFNTPVKSLQKSNQHFFVSVANKQAIKADKVVICAGAKSPSLVKPFGINLPVKPAKGYSLSIPMNGWNNKPTHLIADMSLHAGINPLNNILRVAGTAEFAGFNGEISADRIDNLIGLVDSVYPEFAATMDRTNLNPWAGFRPMSCDGKAILGKTKVDGLYLNTGQGQIGWTTSTASSQLVANEIFDLQNKIDINQYSINRFN